MDDFVDALVDKLDRIFDGLGYLLVWLSVIFGALTIVSQILMYAGRHL